MGCRRIICLLFTLLVAVLWTNGQELVASVNVYTSKLSQSDVAAFVTLRRDLGDLINRTHWTQYHFEPEERIPCVFSLDIQQRNADGTFIAFLTVSSQRPVFDASYRSPMLLIRDKELNFSYQQYDVLDYIPDRLTNNLVASIALYANMIIGLNMDSFGELSGKEQYQAMSTIKDLSVGHLDWQGWRKDELGFNRGVLAESMNQEPLYRVRRAWYVYHRLGLDRMANNPEEAHNAVFASLSELKAFSQQYPGNLFIKLIGNTKLSEITNILQGALREKRLMAYEMLKQIYPAEEYQFSVLKD